MLPSLPEKYYLAHASELFGFVLNQCAHLLSPAHLTYLRGFETLSEDGQCLLVRFLARKPRFFNPQSLLYPEIASLPDACDELTKAGYLSTVRESDWDDFIVVLTKPQLSTCLDREVKIKASASKAELVELARARLGANDPGPAHLRQTYLVRRQQSVVDYILFLYFGDLRNHFQKFAMRDLGVLKTRKSNKNQVARFADQDAALSTFRLHLKYREFLMQPAQVSEALAEYLLGTQGVGSQAHQLRHKLLLSVGDQLVKDQPDTAIDLWRVCDEPLATERWVRETYRRRDRALLKTELEQMREQELPAPTKIFIEDFYARKYQGKRTSVFTDMLREPAQTILVDETFLNDVEDGAIQHYQHRQIDAYFTENRHWRVMFALTFWDLLFGRTEVQHNEFDRLPAGLRSGAFYTDQRPAIERCLSVFDNPDAAIREFVRILTLNYGYPTGLFRWRADLIDSIRQCVLFAPQGAIAKVLLRMAQDYRHSKDGYPDLMIVDQDKLRFEEIKAPGDVLRPNQLVSINRLRRAGFTVDISQVEWATDPNQIYAVVDIETTGGRKGLHAITEIAVVRVRNQKIIDEWSTLVNPERPIPAFITRLTGISNQMVATAPVFQEVADQLDAQLQDAIFVAHNVGFDYGFIKAAYERMNRPFKKPKFCTVRNARKTFPGLESYALGKLTRHFEIDLDNAHRALSDARATADLLVLIQQSQQQH